MIVVVLCCMLFHCIVLYVISLYRVVMDGISIVSGWMVYQLYRGGWYINCIRVDGTIIVSRCSVFIFIVFYFVSLYCIFFVVSHFVSLYFTVFYFISLNFIRLHCVEMYVHESSPVATRKQAGRQSGKLKRYFDSIDAYDSFGDLIKRDY